MSIWIDGENNELRGVPLDDGRNGPIGHGGPMRTDGGGKKRDMSTVGFSLRQHPPRGNQSGQPTLEGWCGSWNNVSTYGRGLARIVRQARNGRLCLARVAPSRAILEELGYPELYDDEARPDLRHIKSEHLAAELDRRIAAAVK